MDYEQFLTKIIRDNRPMHRSIRVRAKYESVYFPSPSIASLQIHAIRVSWGFIHALAELTSEIDYKCNFDELGHCRSWRKWKNGESSSGGTPAGLINMTNQCCCTGCVTNKGYLGIIAKDKITEYAKMFGSSTGFWRAGKGCILPRRLRSMTCLTYSCYDKIRWSSSRPPTRSDHILEALRNIGQSFYDYRAWHHKTKFSKTLNDFPIEAISRYIDAVLEKNNKDQTGRSAFDGKW